MEYASNGNAVELRIYVDTPSDREILSTLLMYRSESHQTYVEQSMNQLGGNQFITHIPGYLIEDLNIYYFFVLPMVVLI